MVSLPTSVQADQPPRVDAPDGFFGQTLVVSISPSSYVFAQAECVQDHRVVYEQFVEIDTGVATFQLGPTNFWSGGDARCVATVGFLKSGEWKPVARDRFDVSG